MNSIRYKLLSAVYILVAIASVLLFDPMALEARTFTQNQQNPQATTDKYKDIWQDRTIKTAPNPGREYQSGQQVGTITIPKMEYYQQPIYYGSDLVNNNWQITTSGYLGNWNMFGEKGVAVVGAHNYQLFGTLPRLENGDLFIIETKDDIYIYEVIGNAVFNHLTDDWTQVAYRDSQDYSVSLMTCYPIEQGALATQDMYIVYTRMVKGTKFE